jgi:hypothetical protein
MSKPVRPKKKIIVNPLEGQLEYVVDNNFSYESVPLNKTLTIAENNQMILMEGLELDGTLNLDGTLILEE